MKKYIIPTRCSNYLIVFFAALVLSAFLPRYSFGQIPGNITESEIQEELNARGLEEEEVRQALIENGYDPDNLAELSPEDQAKVLLIIEELQKNAEEIGEPNEEESEINPEIEEQSEPLELEEDLSKPDTIPADEVQTEIKEISRYGQSLFDNKLIKVYQNSKSIKAPDYYVLGSGDEVAVSIYGRSQIDKNYRINESGYISINSGNVRVYLAGLSMAAARKKLFRAFRSYYSFSEGEFETTLSYSRTIQVSVYGDVENPGPLTVPAINTAFSVLAAANGPTDLGSLRNIKLLRKDGSTAILDLYAYMANPEVQKDFYLNDGDMIHVPTAQRLITLTGAIKKEFIYEVLPSEGLIDLINMAGGLSNNAFKKSMQITRFLDNELAVIDAPYAELLSNNSFFALVDGDIINVGEIDENLKNFVEVVGEVEDGRKFQLLEGMRLLDLINKAGLTPQSKTDEILIQRKLPDNRTSYLTVNLDNILSSSDNSENILLRKQDKVTIWAKSRFVDQASFSIEGAVRIPGEFPFDASNSITVKDAITLAGGLRRDAFTFAHLERKDDLRQNETSYIVVNIEDLFNNPDTDQDVVLRPFDKLHVHSYDVFNEESTIKVSGAVNDPGQYLYGEKMTIRQALILAKGLKLGAALNRIEVSRVIIKDNLPTKTVIAILEIDRDYNVIGGDDSEFNLDPYDAIFVRYVPEFELQKFVTILGEVKFPGDYPILDDNEKISSIVQRAGSPTNEAFLEGARFYRTQDDLGHVVIKLDEIMKNNGSRFNFSVKDGDTLTIPKQKDFVTIIGATRVGEVLSDNSIGAKNEINVPFHKGKNAKFYIDEYAGGIDKERGLSSKVFVEHANGKINKSKKRLFGQKYPEVKKGSTIVVGYKPPKTNEDDEEKEPVDWTKILSDSVAQAVSVLTLILLVQRAN